MYKARVRQHTSEASPAGLLGTPSAATPGKRIKLSRDDGEEEGELVAIKKFKPDKEGEVVTYTGISQSACREIMVRLLFAKASFCATCADALRLRPENRSIERSCTSTLRRFAR